MFLGSVRDSETKKIANMRICECFFLLKVEMFDLSLPMGASLSIQDLTLPSN